MSGASQWYREGAPAQLKMECIYAKWLICRVYGNRATSSVKAAQLLLVQIPLLLRGSIWTNLQGGGRLPCPQSGASLASPVRRYDELSLCMWALVY